MSGWKIIVNWLLPPPLVLTCLLILPMPVVIKKGLLIFTKHFLFAELGPLRLVHVALIITGIAFGASSLHTWQLLQVPLADTLTPNQRTALLARRWREERNFWIATLTFLLWGLLFRFYQLMLEHMELRDRLKKLESGAAAARTALGAATAKRAAASAAASEPGPAQGKATDVEPSAPPAPPAMAAEPKKTK